MVGQINWLIDEEEKKTDNPYTILRSKGQVKQMLTTIEKNKTRNSFIEKWDVSKSSCLPSSGLGVISKVIFHLFINLLCLTIYPPFSFYSFQPLLHLFSTMVCLFIVFLKYCIVFSALYFFSLLLLFYHCIIYHCIIVLFTILSLYLFQHCVSFYFSLQLFPFTYFVAHMLYIHTDE